MLHPFGRDANHEIKIVVTGARGALAMQASPPGTLCVQITRESGFAP
jgi:hypothetical protein